MANVAVDVPQELLDQLARSRFASVSDAERVRVALAIQLFVGDEISVGRAAELAGYPLPKKHVPLPVARVLAKAMEGTWKLLGKQEAPLLSNARIKFLGLNLDYSIAKARRELGYAPQTDFQEGMKTTIDWFRDQGGL